MTSESLQSSPSPSRLYGASTQASGSSSTLERFFHAASSIASAPAPPLSETLPQQASRHVQSLRTRVRRASLSPDTKEDAPTIAGESAVSSTVSRDAERSDAVKQQRARAISNLGPNRKLEGELGMEAAPTSRGLAVQLASSSSLSAEADKAAVAQQQVANHHHQISSAFLISYFIAGGAAGATSRTVVSPLERLKIIMQVQPLDASSATAAGKAAGGGGAAAAARGKGAYSGVWTGLVKMWKEEGFAGFMRGNGINCLRIAPYSAVQFTTYEMAKTWMRDDEGDLDVLYRLTAGAIAGIASVVSTYPLDLVRSRISIASASMYNEAQSAVTSTTRLSPEALRRQIAEKQTQVPGIWAMTAKVYREEGGLRGLYRGCVPTSVGVAPYVALNFVFYEAARKRLSPDEGTSPSALGKLACGALAGSISQTLTYPLDVLRRRMQVAGMKNSNLGYHDKNAIDCIRNIVKAEGIRGLYRGLLPNLLKVAPSIGTSFLTYEAVRGALDRELVDG